MLAMNRQHTNGSENFPFGMLASIASIPKESKGTPSLQGKGRGLGPPDRISLMNWIVPLADLDFGPEEDQAVLDVLHSKWLTMGAVAQAFEQEFAAFHGAKHAVAVSNATQA